MTDDKKPPLAGPLADEYGQLTAGHSEEYKALLAGALRAIANCVDKIAPAPTDWVDAAAAGDVFSSGEAGFVLDKSADTALRMFEAAAAEGYPLGIQRARVCLFSLRRLLNWVEWTQGKSARLACESNARKLAEMRAETQNRQQIAADAAMAAS
jgi:hypothetical protein